MLPTSLESGISIMDYWNMTYGEIVLTIENYRAKELERKREVAGFNYNLANLIGLSVARIMDNKAEYPPLCNAFPGLFDEVVEEVKPVQQDWKLSKARFLQYAEANNKKKRGDVK